MGSTLLRIYDKFILERPVVTLLVTLAVVGFFICHIPEFKLDASGDSLVLENDADLHFHRNITERYGTSGVLVVTYSVEGDLFSPSSLDELKALRDELRQLKDVESVTTILDVPLVFSTNISLSEVADKENIKTLEASNVDKETVLRELHENPLYKGRLISDDGKTTAILLTLPVDTTYRSLLKRRYDLRDKRYNNTLSPQEERELDDVSERYRQHLTFLQHEEDRLVGDVRAIMDRHRGQAQLYLGGVPMIAADMISFIKSDLVIFGVGVLLFLIITLAVIFRRLRWVILSMFICSAAVLTMMGLLGMMDWRVTVISSNFISLMLILTMALTIHLIERYLEVHAQSPDAPQRTLVLETVRTMHLPCLYTALTTSVAFTSLLVSDIRPVMDFGKMMTIGLLVSFSLAFLLFPSIVVLFKKDSSKAGEDFSHPFTLVFARLTEAHGSKILIGSLLLVVISGVGISRLKVENRFIDYFREKTEIFQGMSLIDQKLGGTTPLDLVIDFTLAEETLDDFDADDTLFADEDFGDIEEESHWAADVSVMEQIEKIHDYLDGLPETGEILSLAALGKVTTRLNSNIPLENYELALLYKKVPSDIQDLLIHPYVSEDIPQARFSMRIVESGKMLERQALIDKIRHFLETETDFTGEQIHFTNMFVLYNNMLQSLFHSQILTIGMVFLGIMVMFMVLFRSLYLAAIAIIPNVLPVAVVLGTMGWFNIPLDMMTITIASITIGISVDDTIHYIHRFQKEFVKDRNYMATLYRCHCSIGRALYYTTITITIGFSILVLSHFIPTIYFGLFTGFAMLVALLGDLTLLPKLLITLKPLGPEANNIDVDSH
ncbi:MAG: RND family transporter [Desulfobulbaceae bacterium]|uniref:RND family transporter n=1 Tax=Candidatus Desulfobia pelagia TaxID=2841692 RepID=A0A8J6NCH1_9BACT|nr:RND family transporter [Candidatus Desulfobia pelagia]